MHSTPFSPLATQYANCELALQLYDTHADLATADDFKLLVYFCKPTPTGLLLAQKMLASEAFLLQYHSKKQSPLVDHLPGLQSLLKTSIPALSAALDLLRQAKQPEDSLKQAIAHVVSQAWTVENCYRMNDFFCRIAYREICQVWADAFLAISTYLPKKTRCNVFKQILAAFSVLNPECTAFQTLLSVPLVDNVFDDDLGVFEYILKVLQGYYAMQSMNVSALVLMLNQLASYIAQFYGNSAATFAVIFEIYCCFLQMLGNHLAELNKYQYIYFVHVALEYLTQIARNPDEFDFYLFYQTCFCNVYYFDSCALLSVASLFQKLILETVCTAYEYLKSIKTNDPDYSAQYFCSTSEQIFGFYAYIFEARSSIFQFSYYKDEQIGKVQDLTQMICSAGFFNKLFKTLNEADSSVNQLYTSSKFTYMMQDIRLENRVDARAYSFEVSCWVSLLEIYERGCMCYFQNRVLTPLLRSCFAVGVQICLSKVYDYLAHYLLDLISKGTKADTYLTQDFARRLPFLSFENEHDKPKFVPNASLVNSIYLSLSDTLYGQSDNAGAYFLSEGRNIHFLVAIYAMSFYFDWMDAYFNKHVAARYQMSMPTLLTALARQSEYARSDLQFCDDIILQLISNDIDAAINDAKAKSACYRVDFPKEDETFCWKANNLSIDRITGLIHYYNKPYQFCEFLEDLVNYRMLPNYSVESLTVQLINFPWSEASYIAAAAEFFRLLPVCLLGKNLVLISYCLSVLTQGNALGSYAEFLYRRVDDHSFLLTYCENELPLLKTILNDFITYGSRYMEDLTSYSYKLYYEIVQQNQAQAQPGQLHYYQKPYKSESFDLTPCVQVIRSRLQDYVLPVCLLINDYQVYDHQILLNAIPISGNYQYLAQNAPITSAEYYCQQYFKIIPFYQTNIYLQHSHFLSPHAFAEQAIYLIGHFGAVLNGQDIIVDGFHSVNCVELRLPLFHPIEAYDTMVSGQTIYIYDDTKIIHELKVYLGEAIKYMAVWMARYPYMYGKFTDKQPDEERSAVLYDCEELMIMFLNGFPDEKKLNKNSNEAAYAFCYLLALIYLNGYREFNTLQKDRKRSSSAYEAVNDMELLELVKQAFLNKDVKYQGLKQLVMQNLTKVVSNIQEDKQLPITSSIRDSAQSLLFELLMCCVQNNYLFVVPLFMYYLIVLINMNGLRVSQSATIMYVMGDFLSRFKPELIRALSPQFELLEAQLLEALLGVHNFCNMFSFISPSAAYALICSTQVIFQYANCKRYNANYLRYVYDRQFVYLQASTLIALLRVYIIDKELIYLVIRYFTRLDVDTQLFVLGYLLGNEQYTFLGVEILNSTPLTLFARLQELASGKNFNILLEQSRSAVNVIFRKVILPCRINQGRALYLTAYLLKVRPGVALYNAICYALFSFSDSNFYLAMTKQLFGVLLSESRYNFVLPPGRDAGGILGYIVFEERYRLAYFAVALLHLLNITPDSSIVQKWYDMYRTKYFMEYYPLYFRLAAHAALRCCYELVLAASPADRTAENDYQLLHLNGYENYSPRQPDVLYQHYLAEKMLLCTHECRDFNCMEILSYFYDNIAAVLYTGRCAAVGILLSYAAEHYAELPPDILHFLLDFASFVEVPLMAVASLLKGMQRSRFCKHQSIAASVVSNLTYTGVNMPYAECISCVLYLFRSFPDLIMYISRDMMAEVTSVIAYQDSPEYYYQDIAIDAHLCLVYGRTFFGNFKTIRSEYFAEIENFLSYYVFTNNRQKYLLYAYYYVYNIVNCGLPSSISAKHCSVIDRILLIFSSTTDLASGQCYDSMLGLLLNSTSKDYQYYKQEIQSAEELPELDLLLVTLQVLFLKSYQFAGTESFYYFLEFIITVIVMQTSYYMQIGYYNQAQQITFSILRLLAKLLYANQQLAQVKFGRYLLDYLAMVAFYFLGNCTDIIQSNYYQISDNYQQTLTISQNYSKLPKESLCYYLSTISQHKFNQSIQKEIKSTVVYIIFLFVGYLSNMQKDYQQSLYQDYLLLLLSLYDYSQGRPYYNTLSKLSQLVSQLQESQSIIIPFALVQANSYQFVIDMQVNVLQPELLRIKLEISLFTFIQRITDSSQLTVQAIQLFSKLAPHFKDSQVCIVPMIEKWEFRDYYILTQLCKFEPDVTPAYQYYKQYFLTLALSQFVESAKQIYFSLNKIYVMSILLQDYYAYDINTLKETYLGSCLFLSFLNKTDSYQKLSYPLQQQEESAMKLIIYEITCFAKAVATFEQAISVMLQQVQEQYFKQAILMVYLVYFLVFTAPKPLVDVTKVINQKADLFINMFYKMHHSLAKLLFLHNNSFSQTYIQANSVSFDVQEVAKVGLAAIQYCLYQHQPPPYFKEEFDGKMRELQLKFQQISAMQTLVNQVYIKTFDNGAFKIYNVRIFGKYDTPVDYFYQQSYDALLFKQQFPYYCVQNNAFLMLELIRIASFLKYDVFKKVVYVVEKLYSTPLSSIAFYKHDKRCTFENDIDSMCVGDKHNCIFLGLNITSRISYKAVDYLICELYMKIYEYYYKQVVMQNQNYQMLTKYQQIWPIVFSEQSSPGYYSQFSGVKGVNYIYYLIEMMHNVYLPGIKQYPHYYSYARFSYIQLFVLQLLRLTAYWGDKVQYNEYGYSYAYVQRVLFRIVNLSSDFAQSAYTCLLYSIFNFDAMRAASLKSMELTGCTHDLSMHYFYQRNYSIASIQRLMIYLLLLLPLNSTLIRNNLSYVLLRTLNACYTFPMDIHTLLLLSETFQYQPFHSELTKLNYIVVNYVHANTKRDASKKYSFRVSHHRPAVSSLHQAHFYATFDNSGYDCLNLLEKLFAAGIPHYDSSRNGQNFGQKRLYQQKESLSQIIEQLLKCYQLLNACGAQTAQIDQNYVLLFNYFRTKSSNAYADFFTADAIAAGSLTALSYECAALSAIYLTLLFECVLQKLGVRSSGAVSSNPAALTQQILEDYRKFDSEKEKYIYTNKQALDDLIKQREALEKQILELYHSRDTIARYLYYSNGTDTPSAPTYSYSGSGSPTDPQVYLRQRFIELDGRLSELSRRQAQFKPSYYQLQDYRDQMNQEKFQNIIAFIDKLYELLQTYAQAYPAIPQGPYLLQLCQYFRKTRQLIEDYFKFDSDQQIVTTSLISTEKIGYRILSQMYDDLNASDVSFGVNYPIQYKFTLNNQFFAFSWFTNRRLFELNAQFRHAYPAQREKQYGQFKRYYLSCDQSEYASSAYLQSNKSVLIRNRPTLCNFGFQSDIMMYQMQHNLYKSQPSYDYYQQAFEHIVGLNIDSLSHFNYQKQKEKSPSVKDINLQMHEYLRKNLRSQFKQIIGKISDNSDRNQIIYQLFLKYLNILNADTVVSTNQPNAQSGATYTSTNANYKLDTYRTQLILYEKDCFNVNYIHIYLNNLVNSLNYTDLDNLSQELREEYLKKTTNNDKQHTAFVNQTELYYKLYDALTKYAREIRAESPALDFSSLIQQICQYKLENRPEHFLMSSIQSTLNGYFNQSNAYNSNYYANQTGVYNSNGPVGQTASASAGPGGSQSDNGLIQLNNLNYYFQCQTIALINSIVPGYIRELFNLHYNGTAIFSSVLNIIANDQKELLYNSPELDFEITFDCSLMRKIVEAYAIFAALYPEIALETVMKQGILRRSVGETIVRARSIYVSDKNKLNCGDIQIYQILLFFLIYRFTPSAIAPGPSVLFFENNYENESSQLQLKREIIKDLEYINYEDYRAKYTEIMNYVLESLKFAIHTDVDKSLIPELEYTYQCDAAMLSYQPQIILYILYFAMLSPIENRAIIQRVILLFRDFVIQAYGRKTNRNIATLMAQFHDLFDIYQIFLHIYQLANEFVQYYMNKYEIDYESYLLYSVEKIYYLIEQFLKAKQLKTAELSLSARTLSTLAYTRLLILNGVYSILCYPYPYLNMYLGDSDQQIEYKVHCLAEKLWLGVKRMLEPIRFYTITSLASHLLYVEGDPISAYKLTYDEIIKNYLLKKVYASDEAPLVESAYKLNISQLAILERFRLNIISLIKAGSLSVARTQLQTFSQMVKDGLIIHNLTIMNEMQFLHAFIYEIYIDIGQIAFTSYSYEFIGKIMQELTMSNDSNMSIKSFAAYRHFYGCVITFEYTIDTYIRAECGKLTGANAVFVKQYYTDLFYLTANVINSLINMVTVDSFNPRTDAERVHLLQKYIDSRQESAYNAFERLLTYFITPPLYMIYVIEDKATYSEIEAIGLDPAPTMLQSFCSHLAKSVNAIPPRVIFAHKERIVLEILRNCKRGSHHYKFMLTALLKYVFYPTNYTDFEYGRQIFSLDDAVVCGDTDLYLFLKAVCEISPELSIQQHIQAIFRSKEPSFQDLQQISYLRELDKDLMYLQSQDSVRRGVYDVHAVFYNIMQNGGDFTLRTQDLALVLETSPSSQVSAVLGYYLLLALLFQHAHLDTTAMSVQRTFSAIYAGPGAWTIAIVGYLLQKYQTGERSLASQQQDYYNLLLNILEYKNIYEFAQRLQNKPAPDALRDLQANLCAGLKESNKSVYDNALFVIIEREKLLHPVLLKPHQKNAHCDILCKDNALPAAVAPADSFNSLPYFNKDAVFTYLRTENSAFYAKINFTTVKVVFIDGLPFIYTKLLPAGQTVFLFNASAKTPLLAYAREVLPDFSNLRTASLQQFWARKCPYRTYYMLSFGPGCYAFIFTQKAEFSLLEKLNYYQFNYDFERIYCFKRNLCKQLAAYMLMAEEYFYTCYNLAQLSVDINSGAILPFIMPIKSLAQEQDFQNAAVHSFYLYDLLTSHCNEQQNPVYQKYMAHRRPRTSVPKEFVAFAQPHFVIGVLSAEAAIYARRNVISLANRQVYPYYCVSLDLAYIAPQNMSVDYLNLAYAYMFLDETMLCLLQGQDYDRDSVGQMCNMRGAYSQGIIYGIETQEAKRKVKATNIDNLAQQCSQIKTAMPAVVEWVVGCISADYD